MSRRELDLQQDIDKADKTASMDMDPQSQKRDSESTSRVSKSVRRKQRSLPNTGRQSMNNNVHGAPGFRDSANSVSSVLKLDADSKKPAVQIQVQVTVVKIDDRLERVTTNVEVVVHYQVEPQPEAKEHEFTVGSSPPTDWSPQLRWYNSVEENQLELSYYHCLKSGLVMYYHDMIVVFREALELQRFPFDRQLLKVILGSSNCELTQLVLSKDIWLPEAARDTCAKCAVTGDAAGWKLVGNEMCIENMLFAVMVIKMQREPKFYLWNVVGILFLLVVASFSVVGSPPSEFGDRQSISVTLVLAAVAFKLVVSSMLPPMPYNTYLDYYVLLSFMLLSLGMLENVVVVKLDNQDLAESVDFYYCAVGAGLWAVLHVVFVLVLTVFPLSVFLSWERVREQDDESSEFLPVNWVAEPDF
eukprot:gb/GEZN01009332.1/.p1 GENE.gb/GEZN01009332.1/~~gb/GEZN01009332.1/.p1  ORF type:complete len:416 (+),score=42.68 gb/GEZN01009332.1/:29-1276(+)